MKQRTGYRDEYLVASNVETIGYTDYLHIAAKIMTDLKRVQRFYGAPKDSAIEIYEAELIGLMKKNFFSTITYGFRKGNYWHMALKYAARQGGVVIHDSAPGNIPMNSDIDGCEFASFVKFNQYWHETTSSAKKVFYEQIGLPYTFRKEGEEPVPRWKPGDGVDFCAPASDE